MAMMQEVNLAYHVCVDLCMGGGTKDLGDEVNPHLLAHPYHHNKAILCRSKGGMGGGRKGIKKEREEGKGGREGDGGRRKGGVGGDGGDGGNRREGKGEREMKGGQINHINSSKCVIAIGLHV